MQLDAQFSPGVCLIPRGLGEASAPLTAGCLVRIRGTRTDIDEVNVYRVDGIELRFRLTPVVTFCLRVIGSVDWD